LNTQVIQESLAPWLNEHGADVYILGFQEIDLSVEAFMASTDTIKEDTVCKSIQEALVSHPDLYLKAD
jgi:hypothetical protein